MSVRILTLIFLLTVVRSAIASPIYYRANLSNAGLPNPSSATALAEVGIDTALHSLTVHVEFAGLSALATDSDLYAPCHLPPITTPNPYPGPTVPQVSCSAVSFSAFPTVTAGSYFNMFNTSLISTFNEPFLTNNGGTAASAEAALAAFLAARNAYVDIHTAAFPDGEINGFLNAVPETSTLGLVGAALT